MNGTPTLSGWGRSPVVPGREVRSEDLNHLTLDRPLSRGLGRSYGDSSLPAARDQELANSTLADRILGFDPATGDVRAEAGLSLRDIIRVFLPQGFFTPVTPGTQYVTLGGMVAADIHGKNHHVEGCFGAHVSSLTMRVADGRVVTCSPTVERDLFRATVGGMGLTGHILEVSFRLARVPSPWIYCESQRVHDIDEFIHLLKESSARWPITVGWIDCLSGGKKLGRGTLYKGRWAEASEAPKTFPRPKGRLSVPFNMPEFLLGPLAVRLMNTANYWRHIPAVKKAIVHPETYFYPLDVLHDWHRLYGRRGLTQHQCVLPDSAGRGAARRFLELLVAKGGASFLCVIKDCGAEGQGLLSFPKPGVSIALDIAVRDNTQELIDALNEQVIKEGGRIYLTKDAFTRPEHFRAMEPRLPAWEAIRRTWDPTGKFRSAQSVRLLGDKP